MKKTKSDNEKMFKNFHPSKFRAKILKNDLWVQKVLRMRTINGNINSIPSTQMLAKRNHTYGDSSQ